MTPLSEANFRSVKRAAATSPISMATIRSKATVIRAVRTNTNASARVERMMAVTVRRETMRVAVTIRIPARTASGIFPTRPAAR